MKTSNNKNTITFKTFAGLFALALFLGCGKPSEEKSTQTNAPAAQAAAPAAVPAVAPTPAVAPAAAVEAAPAAETTKLAPGMVRYEALPTGSYSKIEGDSTLHEWKMESKILGGSIEADEKFPESALADAKAAKPVVYSFMPVKSFKSGTKKMDDVMQDSMNATAHPKIEYRLIELKPKSPAGTTGATQFEAIGSLTISGVTITNTMPVTIEKKDGKLKVNGSTPLKLSDFNVTIKLTGIASLMNLKVKDDLKISFEWALAPKAN